MMATLFLMDSSVTATAECLQVFQRIVAQMPWRGSASAVNVMDMKIFGDTAALTGEIVPFQCCLSVAPEVVVVFCFSDVLTSFRILLKCFACLFGAAFLQARLTVLLRSRAIGEIDSAVGALEDGSNWRGSFLFPQSAQMKNILLLAVNRTADITALLSRSRRFVEHFTNDAPALLESIAGLTVGRQCTRLTSLEIWRSLRHLRSALGAVKDAVLPRFHSLNYELSLP